MSVEIGALNLKRIISSWTVADVLESARHLKALDVLDTWDIEDIADTLEHDFDASLGMKWDDLEIAVKNKLQEKKNL